VNGNVRFSSDQASVTSGKRDALLRNAFSVVALKAFFLLATASCDSSAGLVGSIKNGSDPNGAGSSSGAWVRVDSGTMSTLHDVRGLTGSVVIASGGDGTVLRSEDGGSSWTYTSTGSTLALSGIWDTGSELILSGISASGQDDTHYLRSTDGGVTWTGVSIPNVPSWWSSYGIDGSGPIILMVGSGYVQPGVQRAILRSEDGGATWLRVAVGTGIGFLRDVWGEGQTFVAVGDNGALVRSTDGGQNWTTVDSPTGFDLLGVTGTNEAIVAVGRNGHVIRSEDGGASWSLSQTGTQTELRGVWGEGSTLLAVGIGPTILRSRDAGVTWESLETPLNAGLLFGVWGSGSTAIAVGASAGGLILRTTGGI